jgi:hypothetical protein
VRFCHFLLRAKFNVFQYEINRFQHSLRLCIFFKIQNNKIKSFKVFEKKETGLHVAAQATKEVFVSTHTFTQPHTKRLVQTLNQSYYPTIKTQQRECMDTSQRVHGQTSQVWNYEILSSFRHKHKHSQGTQATHLR